MYENYYIRQIDSNPPPPAPSKKIVQTKSSFSKVKKSTIQKKKKKSNPKRSSGRIGEWWRRIEKTRGRGMGMGIIEKLRIFFFCFWGTDKTIGKREEEKRGNQWSILPHHLISWMDSRQGILQIRLRIMIIIRWRRWKVCSKMDGEN